MNKRTRLLTTKQINKIKVLYQNSNLFQYEIGEIFGCDKSHVSRIVNNINFGFQFLLAKKRSILEKNIEPPIDEPKQAKKLRAKRASLYSAKLNWNKVVNLRSLYFLGKETQVQLAKRFNIAQSTVSRIITGEKWKKNK